MAETTPGTIYVQDLGEGASSWWNRRLSAEDQKYIRADIARAAVAAETERCADANPMLHGCETCGVGSKRNCREWSAAFGHWVDTHPHQSRWRAAIRAPEPVDADKGERDE